MFNIVPSGTALKADGKTEKFFDFPAALLKSSDYPHLPKTSVGAGESKKDVPVVRVSPSTILVREYPSLADAKASAVEHGVSAERFEVVVLELLNKAERDSAVRVARSTIAELKQISADPSTILVDILKDVNIFAEASGGRESNKEKQTRAGELLKLMLTGQRSAEDVAREMAAIFNVTA